MHQTDGSRDRRSEEKLHKLSVVSIWVVRRFRQLQKFYAKRISNKMCEQLFVLLTKLTKLTSMPHLHFHFLGRSFALTHLLTALFSITYYTQKWHSVSIIKCLISLFFLHSWNVNKIASFDNETSSIINRFARKFNFTFVSFES